MPELLTVAQVRNELWVAGLPADSGPSNPQQASAVEMDTWLGRLNQVVERFITEMVAARTYRRIDVPIYDGQFTLPRDVRSCLQVSLLNEDQFTCSPLFIYSRFHQFAQCCGECGATGFVQPISENAQTFRVPTGPFKLRCISTQANGSYQLIGGKDTSDDEYFDLVELAITNGTTTTTREWNTLPRFAKPVTNEPCFIYGVDSDGEQTLIAVHAPGEENPAYQRYSAPQWGDEPAARVLTRLCYVKLVADTDIVIPSNYGALKLGLQALRYEDVNDWNRANAAWAQGMQLIDKEKQLLEGEAEVPLMRLMPGFGCADMASNGGWPAFNPWGTGGHYGY